MSSSLHEEINHEPTVRIWEVEEEEEVEDMEEIEEMEEMVLPSVINEDSALPVEEGLMSWPPRPSFSNLGEYYDQLKEFILDSERNELIFPPMDGEQRKMVHYVAELFSLHTKSYGGKTRRHVRVFKSDDVPHSVDLPNNGQVAQKNSVVGMKEMKIPLYIKTSAPSLREEVICNTPDGVSLRKLVIREGEGDATPTEGELVYVHYEGYYEDGGVFDSSRYREKECSFIVGQGQVIPGWDLSVSTMKVGELSELIIPPQFAFGVLGCPPRIPAGATLRYEVELLRFSAPMTEEIKSGENIPDSLEKCLERAYACKAEGNALVSSKSFRKASKSYNRAVSYVAKFQKLSENEEAQLVSIRVPLYSNLALCYLKLHEYSKAQASCEKVSLEVTISLLKVSHS